MEKKSSSVQSWVEDHKLTTIGALWATAVGASVAYSRLRRATGLTVAAALGGAALVHQYHTSSAREKEEDLEFYSQLPAATADDGQENERWSY